MGWGALHTQLLPSAVDIINNIKNVCINSSKRGRVFKHTKQHHPSCCATVTFGLTCQTDNLQLFNKYRIPITCILLKIWHLLLYDYLDNIILNLVCIVLKKTYRDKKYTLSFKSYMVLMINYGDVEICICYVVHMWLSNIFTAWFILIFTKAIHKLTYK